MSIIRENIYFLLFDVVDRINEDEVSLLIELLQKLITCVDDKILFNFIDTNICSWLCFII